MIRPGAWWGAAVGAVLAYVAAVLLPVPGFYFFPGLDSWGILALPGVPAVRWYGWLLYAAAGGLFGFAAGSFIRRRPPWALVWLIATTSLLVLAWHERQWFLK